MSTGRRERAPNPEATVACEEKQGRKEDSFRGVLTGADRLAAGLSHPLLEGKRLGLVTNPTGITSDFRLTASVLAELPSSRLTALFACEHGTRGQHQAGVRFEGEWDERLDVPVYSLYGRNTRPQKYMLSNVDTVVFDVQDLGIRFYTYLSTLLYVMEACAGNGKSLLVLDRPNPLGGLVCEGGLLKRGYESMVGAWSMPIRTGMTLGELALMANEKKGLGCDLSVIPMERWERGMEYGSTGLPWMLPSPNMPTVDTVRVYGGTCLFEGTNLSEGRGTTRPFEWIGAPWLDGEVFAEAVNRHELPGVYAHPVYMTPSFSKHQGILCGGVRLFVTDPGRFHSVQAGLVLLHEARSLYPEHFEWLAPPKTGSRYFIDLLSGGDEVRTSIGRKEGLARITDAWLKESEEWREARRPYLLYS
ncbi:uncharacterized protein YbbC (DUF1343 family) [Paenibacillus forsythiae]|uniref:Uncharacterized protein YbbC (DUF1343 family) n=1 Tax=Paenibacillus forsythiae TaxID=365616 RepID=A0ABU3H293_9BACL|nr:DUF1343 domain-containing protein [Paenibacillus forsythiae]MDT3424939.1 uncharacterized protein YbbC (DUF1343 family) [Paenibacillus forsythiae]